MHLADAALDGQRRAVGQPRLERAPDPLDGVVVWAVARPVQHLQPGVLAQPALHDLGAVDDHVVADHRDHRRRGVGGQELLAEGGEGGADRLAGHLVEEPPEGQVHRAKDRPSPVLARGHDLLALPVRDPGGAHPRPQAEGGTAKPLVQPSDPPRLGLGQQPADAVAKLGAAQAWPSRSGPVDKPGRPVLVVAVDPAAHRGPIAAQQPGDGDRGPAAMGQQDHDQADPDAMGAIQRTGHLAGAASGQERLAYTLEDAYWRRRRRVCGLWKASATREATSLLGPPPPVTSRTSGHPLRATAAPTVMAVRIPAAGPIRVAATATRATVPMAEATSWAVLNSPATRPASCSATPVNMAIWSAISTSPLPAPASRRPVRLRWRSRRRFGQGLERLRACFRPSIGSRRSRWSAPCSVSMILTHGRHRSASRVRRWRPAPSVLTPPDGSSRCCWRCRCSPWSPGWSMPPATSGLVGCSPPT